mgnify:CR=1 FL=1
MKKEGVSMIRVKKIIFLYLVCTFTVITILSSTISKAGVLENISIACCVYENESYNSKDKSREKVSCHNYTKAILENQNKEQSGLFRAVAKILSSSKGGLSKAFNRSYDKEAEAFLASHETLAEAYETKYGRKCEPKENSSDFKVFTASNQGRAFYQNDYAEEQRRPSESQGRALYQNESSGYETRAPYYKAQEKKSNKRRKKDNEPNDLSFGLILGANVTFYDLTGTYRSYDRNKVVGFQGGINAVYFFSDTFAFGLGLLYQNRGVEFYDVNYDLAKRNYHYLEVPITVGYDLHRLIKVYGGTQLSLFLSGTRKSDTLGTTTIAAESMNTFTVSILVGGLFHIWNDVYLDLSYVYGLQDEVKDITNKNRAFQGSLVYYF